MRKRRDLGQPSDIAFLLIIFFLLLAGINTTQSIALHTNTSDTSQTDTVVLQALLTQQGVLLLEDQIYTPLEFANMLTPNTTLHLRVEAETSWQQVVDLLSLTEQRMIAALSLTMAEDTSPTEEENRKEKIEKEADGKNKEREITP